MPAQEGAGAGRSAIGTGAGGAGSSRWPIRRPRAAVGRLEAAQVRAMFDRIAGVYDVMNTAMTAGLHHRWRERAADLAQVGPGSRVLDVATGTGRPGDRARAPRLPGGRGGGLRLRRRHARASARQGVRRTADGDVQPRFEWGDALELPYRDDLFDAATVGFGARNFADLRARLWRRWLASCARGGEWWCSRSRPPRAPRCRSSTDCGSTGSCPLSGGWRARSCLWLARRSRLGVRGPRSPTPTPICPTRSSASRRPPCSRPRWSARGCRRSATCSLAGGIVAIHAGTVPAERA